MCPTTEKTRDELRVQVYDAMAERTEEKKDKDADNKETEEEEVVAATAAAAEDKEGSDNQQDAAKEGEDDTKKEVHEGKANSEVKPENGTEDNQESEDKEDEEAKGDAVGCSHCGKRLFNELTAKMFPAVFMTTWPVSDGEEEDSDDAEMEADAEEQGEEGDATEKVWGQQTEPYKSKNSRLLKNKCCILGQR